MAALLFAWGYARGSTKKRKFSIIKVDVTNIYRERNIGDIYEEETFKN